MTVLGWYERARLAYGFSPAALAVMGRKGVESRLRQNAAGVWEIEPVASFVRKIRSAEDCSWEVKAPVPAKLSLRVKAAYGTAPYEAETAKRLLGAGDVPRMKINAAAKGVVQTVTAATDAEHGRTVVFSSENRDVPTEKAWTEAYLHFGHPFRDLRVPTGDGSGAFGFWLKGDGSGAVLDLQVRSPGMYDCGWSDHIIKIDFTGWRYVTFHLRERDIADFVDYIWAHPVYVYPQFRQLVNLKWVERVSVMLTRIPAHGKTVVEMSEIRVLPTVSETLTGVSVSVGGQTHPVPFALASGEWAEKEDGFWTRYAKTGDPVERKPGSDDSFDVGTQRCVFRADRENARAEVVLFARGKARSALADGVTSAKQFDYEAMLPQWYEPAKGFCDIAPIVARPGEQARVELEVFGVVANPTLTFPEGKFRLPVETAVGERLVCRDGRTWQVKDASGKVVRVGRLEAAMPLISSRPVSLTADLRSAARFNVVKRYVRVQ